MGDERANDYLITEVLGPVVQTFSSLWHFPGKSDVRAHLVIMVHVEEQAKLG